ncbi:MAG TPA: AI-2E family transporter [Clostridiales bacterium]|nr:AI-2E family transporter [Clostridiales bacterium]
MELNKENMRKLLFLAAFSITLFLVLQNLSSVIRAARVVLGLLTPFFIGAAMAFLLYVPLQFFEQKIFTSERKLVKAIRRPLSILLSVLLVAAVLFVVIVMLVPQIAETVQILTNVIPLFFRSIPEWADRFTQSFPDFNQWLETLSIDWNRIGNSILDFIRNSTSRLLGSTISAISYVFNITFNLIVASVFSIYILLNKEKLAEQAKMLLFAYLPERRAERIIEISRLAQKTFYKFVTGQIIEATILGLLCFAGMLVLRIPFAPVASVLIFITAFIPLFGALIGTGLAAFIILMVNPLKALWFIIFIILLQQFEGNIIYPRVMGTTVGLPAMWVVLAVTLGGGTLGIPGMLLAVPVASVIYTLLKEAVRERLKKKGINHAEQKQ